MTWQELIDRAYGAGYKVHECEERGFIVTTPKAYRRAPEEHAGGFKDQRAAWKLAAYLWHKDHFSPTTTEEA